MALQPLEQVFELAADGEYDEAIAGVDAMLDRDDSIAGLHALRAFLLLETERPTEAAISVKKALAIDPSDPYVLRAAAEVALATHEPAEAIATARKLRELDPTDDESVLVEARARLMLGQWDDVVARLDYVLAGDPQNELAATLRAVAQEQKAGGRGPIGAADWETLSKQFPANPFARTGHAWTLLGRGKAGAARDQFRQALAIDPGSVWAKQGMVLALKARYPGYGLLLRFFCWMHSLPPRTSTLIVFGGFIGYNALRSYTRTNPEVQPFVMPILVAYGVFVLATWLADPLLNLALSLHPEGRTVLSDDDRTSGRRVGAALGTAILLAALAALTPWKGGYLAAITVGLASLPIAGAYNCTPGKYRDRLLNAAIILTSMGIAASLAPMTIGGLFGVVAIFGLVATTWFARSWAARNPE